MENYSQDTGPAATSAGQNGNELTLDPGSYSNWIFVGEGNANTVFANSGPSVSSQKWLVRLPKAGRSAFDYEIQQQYWQTAMRPLFADENLVEQVLGVLGGDESDDIVGSANDILARLDASSGRRADFLGSRVAETKQMMCVEDMRPRSSDEMVIEFKPKWLAQSPSAPASALRCRNCARWALRRLMGEKHISAAAGLCPLDLILCRDEEGALDRVMAALAPGVDPASPHGKRLRQWFRSNTLMPQLSEIQRRLDPVGPLAAETNEPAFLQAMTLRDCTCYVRVSLDCGVPVEAKLGDLDMKNAAVKERHWREIEQRLHEMGCYSEEEEPRQETHCSLGKLPR